MIRLGGSSTRAFSDRERGQTNVRDRGEEQRHEIERIHGGHLVTANDGSGAQPLTWVTLRSHFKLTPTPAMWGSHGLSRGLGSPSRLERDTDAEGLWTSRSVGRARVDMRTWCLQHLRTQRPGRTSNPAMLAPGGSHPLQGRDSLTSSPTRFCAGEALVGNAQRQLEG
ncbi:hypothetical protein JHW43_006028 [Diplocarpon mali]|nr:hypothetical protein JHW43_006028 [Diplocarpon mali]